MLNATWNSYEEEAMDFYEESPSYTEEELACLKAVRSTVYDFVAHSPAGTLSDLKGGNLTLFCCKAEDEMKKRYFLSSSRRRALRQFLPPEELLEVLAEKAMAALPQVTALTAGRRCKDKPDLFEAERNLRTIIAAFYSLKAA